MQEPKEPQALIMQSWIEPTRNGVPDPAERCRVWEYVFAESMRIAYGVEHNEPKPEGAAAVAVGYLLPQLQKMCEKYIAKVGKLAQNLEKANAAKAAKRAGTPHADTKPHAGTDAAPTEEPPHADTHAGGASCKCNANAPYKNKTKQENINIYPPHPQGDEEEIFLCGLDMIERGKKIQADTLRGLFYTARNKAKAGEVRNEKGYLCGCLKSSYSDRGQAAAVANFLRVADIRKPEALEVEALEVRETTLVLFCTDAARQAIEGAVTTNRPQIYKAMQQIGCSLLEYRITDRKPVPMQEPRTRGTEPLRALVENVAATIGKGGAG